ncbi:hypothetical protein QQZ08_011782 [Neonectria magnoliae]|uniref:GPI anchored serine-rich protein n=1 Tax=Neonectria magnoliae TaxID=2732573 RepID=A0ABR1H7B6_9HYPO
MRFTILSVAAASASLVAATYDLPVEDTTTLTSTTTRVLTLTACPDSVVDCPYRTTTSTEEIIITTTSQWIPTTTPAAETTSIIYTPPPVAPVVNTTSVYIPIPKTTWYPAGNTTTHGPTAPVTHITKPTHSSTVVVPTTFISENVPSGTPVVEVPSSSAPPSVPSEVPASGASGLYTKSGVVGAVVVAALAALY